MRKPKRIIVTVFLFFFSGCASQPDQGPVKNHKLTKSALRIISKSCQPCHHQGLLSVVINKTKQRKDLKIQGETRPRIIAELEELKETMQDGVPLSFTSEENLIQFLKIAPGEFYIMLEKGVMPPRWAPHFMQAIDWSDYQPLTPKKRVDLLRFAKPYSEKYLR